MEVLATDTEFELGAAERSDPRSLAVFEGVEQRPNRPEARGLDVEPRRLPRKLPDGFDASDRVVPRHAYLFTPEQRARVVGQLRVLILTDEIKRNRLTRIAVRSVERLDYRESCLRSFVRQYQ